MKRSIVDLKDRHKGADVWLIGAASSMDHVSPGFFSGKVSVAVNFAYRRFPATYRIATCKRLARADSDIPLILARWQKGRDKRFKTTWKGMRAVPYLFNHRHTLAACGPDELIVWKTTMLAAMHAAAYMGARNIILCGVDGGWLDGRARYAGYRDHEDRQDEDKVRAVLAAEWADVPEWMRLMRELRGQLRERYGCETYSLSPFIGFDLEGHRLGMPHGRSGSDIRARPVRSSATLRNRIGGTRPQSPATG